MSAQTIKSSHADKHHIVSLPTYFAIYVALLVLLGATVGVYYLNLGFWSIAIGVLIAVVKAVLILLYFMHVRFSSKLVMVFAVAGFIWLAIMIGLTFSDYISRDWLPEPSPMLVAPAENP